MKRTNTALWSIAIVVLALAVAAAPAAARTEISSTSQVTRTAGDPAAGTTQSQPAPVVTQSSGFEWDDAVVGALGALGLVSISLVTVAAMRRHHRLTVESRA